jgi:hypothetical protein
MRSAIALAAFLLALAACGDSGRVGADGSASMVPREFEAACGRPGTEVRTQADQGFVRHADCDLTGVSLVRDGRGGAVVPARGEGVANSDGLQVTRAQNGDVTFRWSSEQPREPGGAYG